LHSALEPIPTISATNKSYMIPSVDNDRGWLSDIDDASAARPYPIHPIPCSTRVGDPEILGVGDTAKLSENNVPLIRYSIQLVKSYPEVDCEVSAAEIPVVAVRCAQIVTCAVEKPARPAELRLCCVYLRITVRRHSMSRGSSISKIQVNRKQKH